MSAYPLSTSLLRRRVVRSPEKRRAGQPTSRAGLTAHRRGSHAHAPPQVAGHDCEPALTLAATPDET